MQEYIDALRSYMRKDYWEMYREKGGIFRYGFLTPGSASYSDVLWDWDSYFSNVALKQILADAGADREEARGLCEKTIRLFGRDIIRFGAMHEYYSPDDGEPVMNPGFQNWNMLVLNMIYWYEGKEHIEEF